MGKREKEHRKKVAKRNARIREDRKKLEKLQHTVLMKLIEEEKNRGSFDSPVMPLPGFEGPSLGMPTPLN